MKNFLIITLAIVLGITISGLVLKGFKSNNPLGSINTQHYSGGVVNSSSTVRLTATTTPILAKNLERQWARICNVGSGIVWLQETATTTDVAIGKGIPIASSTNYTQCYTIDQNHPYIGQVLGIAENSTTVVNYIEK